MTRRSHSESGLFSTNKSHSSSAKDRDLIPKGRAVKKAANLVLVENLLRALNEPVLLRQFPVTDAAGEPLAPLDWIGSTLTLETQQRLGGPRSAGFPYDHVTGQLASLGLSLSDLGSCENCRMWFLKPSSRTRVCPSCRGGREWETLSRRRRRELVKSRRLRTESHVGWSRRALPPKDPVTGRFVKK
jgi:hypothetical protein